MGSSRVFETPKAGELPGGYLASAHVDDQHQAEIVTFYGGISWGETNIIW